MNLHDITYEKLLIYAINRIRKEYGSISAFTRSIECKQLGLKKRDGKSTPGSTIRQYLSYTEGKKINRNIKFLKILFKGLWNKTITSEKIIQIETILRANIY